MQAGILSQLCRLLEQHSAAISIPVLLIAIAVAYWVYAVVPYRRDRPSNLQSPAHVCRPAVPGVLENWSTEREVLGQNHELQQTDQADPVETNQRV